MNQITDVLRDSKRLRLIATALELLQYEKIDSAVIPIPGTEPQRYVVVGTAATVARLLEIAPAAQEVTQPRPTDDDLWDATLRDRDAYHEWADKLAEAIAVHFGVDIGEHSNANLPWSEALDAIEQAVDSPYPRLAAVREWVATAPHGENCYLTDDPEFDRCLCGKENALDIIEGATSFVAQEVTQQATPEALYRVAEFWSSANPGSKVRMLAEGKDIVEWVKRSDFIRWVDAPEALSDFEIIDLIHSRRMTPRQFADKYESAVASIASIVAAPEAPATTASASDEQSRAEQVLRRLLAYRCAGSLLYADDGELQDNSARPAIDFKRDSVDTIETKLGERAALARAPLPAQAGEVKNG